MVQPPTLAEILADDTGRIRPEIADLLMEPMPQRPRPRPQRRPHPGAQRPQARQQPRLMSIGWLFFGLIVFIILLLLLFSGEREPKRTVQNWDNTKNKVVSNYSDREASVFQKPEKEIIPPMASESNQPMPSTPNTEAIETSREKENEENPQSGIQEIPSEIQRKQYYPNTETVPQYQGGRNFNRTFKCDVQQKQWPTYIVRRRYYRPPMSSNCVAIGTIRRSPIPVIQQRVSFQSNVARIETYSYRAGQFNRGYFIARRIDPPYQRGIQPQIRAYYYSQCRPYCFR